MTGNLEAPRPAHPRLTPFHIDYTTANDPNLPALNETQRADLYAELASGAESGWDYTARWFTHGPTNGTLRDLNVRSTIAVDLNSVLCTCCNRLEGTYQEHFYYLVELTFKLLEFLMVMVTSEKFHDPAMSLML